MNQQLATPLTKKYGLRAPIVQAGMAFAGMTPDLGVALCNAGVMGSIAGVGILSPEVVRHLVGGMFAGTDRAFHVNFIAIYTEQAHIDLMCEMRPAAVSFHWGHPGSSWIDQLHAAGIDVWEQVGSVDAACNAVDGGIDVVIAQGSEAGGHNYGTAGTVALTPAVVDAVAGEAMVLAAGGIADGRGLAAALALGADGAWIGTRFVATVESAVANEYKQRIIGGRACDTAITHVFGRHHPQFNPMRVLRNRVVEEWNDHVADIPADTGTEAPVGEMDLFGQPTPLHRFTNMVPMAGATGDFDELPLLAGEGIGLITDAPPAAEVVDRMIGEAEAALSRFRL